VLAGQCFFFGEKTLLATYCSGDSGQKGGLFSLFFRGFVLPETVLGFAGVCMDNHRNQASLCSALNLVYNCYGLN
jgi:hypothetical protein